jgi:hypothetical protein
VKYANSPKSGAFPDEVQVNLHMLGALMLDGVGGEVGGANVVAVDEACRR